MSRHERRLTVKDGAMIGAGMLSVSAAALFYRSKRTTPFKWAYFASWPLLGGSLLSAFVPDRQDIEQELRQRGLDSQALEINKDQVRLQMEMLKDIASKGKPNDQYPTSTGAQTRS